MIFSDLLRQFFIAKLNFFEKYQGTDSHTNRLGGVPDVGKQASVIFFNRIPKDFFQKKAPAIIASHIAAEGKKKVVFKTQLPMGYFCLVPLQMQDFL